MSDLETLLRAKHRSRLRRMVASIWSDEHRERLDRLIALQDDGYFAGSALSRQASDEELGWLCRIVFRPCDWDLVIGRARELAEFSAHEQAS